MAKYKPSALSNEHWFLGSGNRTAEFSAYKDEFSTLLSPIPEEQTRELEVRIKQIRSWEYWSVLRHIDLVKTDRVLDVGSWSTFAPLLWMADRAEFVWANDNGQFSRGAETSGFLEWWHALEKYDRRNIGLLTRNVSELNLDEDRFDVITSFSTIEHIDLRSDPDADTKASLNMFRMLKPGGLKCGTIDFGRPEEGEPLVRMYDVDLFHSKIVEPAGWRYVSRPYPVDAAKDVRSAMVYLLTK